MITRGEQSLRHVTLSLGLALLASACANQRTGSRAPDHEALVNAHMRGDYGEVLDWCPVLLEDPGADPAVSDWCLFGYPAALRLALDNEAAVVFMRTACTDLTGKVVGDEDFRVFFVREVARWLALPLRHQGLDATLPRAVRSVVQEFSGICQVEADAVARGLDTQIRPRRGKKMLTTEP